MGITNPFTSQSVPQHRQQVCCLPSGLHCPKREQAECPAVKNSSFSTALLCSCKKTSWPKENHGISLLLTSTTA